MIRRNRDCARGERSMKEKGGKGGGRRRELIFIHSKPGRTPGSPAWIDTLPRVHSPDRAHPQAAVFSFCFFLLKLSPYHFFPFLFLLKICFSFSAGKNRGLFSGKGNKGKRGGDTKTTMDFAEAEQTDRASKRCLRHIVDIQLRLSGQLKAGWLSSSEVFKNVLLRVGCERKRWLEKKL